MFKFYRDNKKHLVQYFQHRFHSADFLYQYLLDGGHYSRMNEIIRERSSFDFEGWKEELAQL